MKKIAQVVDAFVKPTTRKQIHNTIENKSNNKINIEKRLLFFVFIAFNIYYAKIQNLMQPR